MMTLNAVGKTAQEAATMTQTVLDKGAEEFQILVDGASEGSEVKRLLELRGFSVELQDDDGRLSLIGRMKTGEEGKARTPQETPPHPAPSRPQVRGASPTPRPALVPATNPSEGTFAVLIAGDALGRGEKELGEILMRSFLGSLAKTTPPPEAVGLLNDGVKLAVFDTSTCDHLKDLEARGSRVLVCGTSANHLGLNDSVGVGVLSNMPEIIEAIRTADSVLSV
ncbi:MAG: sulfurtransferase-like selenium metabolism protein YedF [Fretibacterium sp.]|nr:sulfurtransferase-like selenium metabolism protein YedF [Fretibacterium sp.]